MKRTTLCIIAMLLTMTAMAQKPAVKEAEISIEDIKTVLEAKEIFLHSFDMTEFNDGVYSIIPFVEEYENGKLNEESLIRVGLGMNKTDVRKFGERADEWRETYGMKRRQNVHTLMNKAGIYLYPVSDSTIKVTFNMENIGSFGAPLHKKAYGKGPQADSHARYSHRPFKLVPKEHAEIIRLPLVMVGSFWYDERYDVYRFCGEKEIDPELTSEILKNCPHYFIIGIELHEGDL